MPFDDDRSTLLGEATLSDARVLLGAVASLQILGRDLDTIGAGPDTPLLDALASTGTISAALRHVLGTIRVERLGVNRATASELARIPGVTPTAAEALVRARPYFSRAHLSAEGSDLRAVADLGVRYLAHEDFSFVDKPRGSVVVLTVADDGFLVRYQPDAAATAARALDGAGFEVDEEIAVERLLRCRWVSPESERPRLRRMLKEHAAVETVFPLLRDSDGALRTAQPGGIDVMLSPGVPPSDVESLKRRFGLDLVREYSPGFLGCRVSAAPHDIGHAFRVLRALSSEAAVAFAEPTYL